MAQMVDFIRGDEGWSRSATGRRFCMAQVIDCCTARSSQDMHAIDQRLLTSDRILYGSTLLLLCEVVALRTPQVHFTLTAFGAARWS